MKKNCIGKITIFYIVTMGQIQIFMKIYYNLYIHEVYTEINVIIL